MTTKQEQLGAYKRELAELRSIAVELYNRILELEKNADKLVGVCSHPKAQDRTMMGAEARSMHCKDCGGSWEVPFEAAKGA